VLGLIGLGALAGLGVIVYLSQDLPSFEQIENTENLLATQVRTADNQELARYYAAENRTWVALDEMSPLVPQALIATEDRRFYDHWGVDGYAIGAIIKDVVTGRGARGASTITMQLSRNLYREATGFRIGERSIVRKAKEILIAVRLERTYTKPEILEAYLNTVPFLYNAYGIEAAAQTFFSKPALDLDASESATLVGMLAANSRYNPCLAPGGTSSECLDADGEAVTVSQNEASITRRNVVLTNMRDQAVLDEAAYRAAYEMPINLAFDVYSHEDNIAPHFAEVLRMWFTDWAEANDYDPYEDGLVIHTTIDSRMQALAAEAVQEEMDRLQGIVGRGWGSAANPFGRWWGRNTAVVNEYIGLTDRYRALAASGVGAEEAVAQLRGNDVFMDSLKAERTRLEAGLIAMDPRSGQVKAWVGGRNFVVNKYDHVGQARRQPGSTFKIFAYTTAFNNGYSPQSGAFDSPFRWGDWAPRNSGGGYAGYTSLADALRASRNVVAARITKHFGTSEIARTAYQMGIRTPLELPEFDDTECPPFEARKNDCYARAISLGTQDVSLLEMVNAYATVANYGVYHGPTIEEDRPPNSDVPPHIVLAIDRIEDRYGNVIADFTPVGREVLNPSTAYTTFNTMRAVVRSGTGRGLGGFRGVGPLDVAGKTGTTQENADGWFIGMTPELVVGSWTGFPDRRLTYPSTSIGQGGRTGLRNVGAFLSKLQMEGDSLIRLDPNLDLERPDNYQPPTRRSRIGDRGYWPGDSRNRARSRGGSSSGNSRNSSADRPARDMIDRFRQRERAAPAPQQQPRPQTNGGGSGGRIGW
ncbi:transglycosylase domain-containing protein, partial [Rubrivirga sp.]|uniref:transglycosylase domain-containing protein n=1 Tax=Rubrivirga sp. TaxID=1885344 RepID=UPI003C746758